MAFSLKQWTTRSIALALAGEDMNTTPVLDPEDIAEAYAHHCMFEVAELFAADPATRHLVTETITIALTNGAGTIPSRVLPAYVPFATVTDPADPAMGRKMRWVPWEDFIRTVADANRGYFSSKGTTLYLTRPSAAYVEGAGMTGNISLTTAAAVDMPATESATIAVPLRIELALVEALAAKLRVPRRREAA